MRWDNLFDDLESQLERELTAEELDLRAEEERTRLGRLSLRERLVALHEREPRHPIGVELTSGRVLTVRPTTFGRDWFSAEIVGSASVVEGIIALQAISSVLMSREQSATSAIGAPGESQPQSLGARISLPFVLRDLCRRRVRVDVHSSRAAHGGTIDRVGRDHLELAEHATGSPRRTSAVTGYRIVPLATLEFVRL